MITFFESANWKDLQIKVAEILSECGFATTIEKKVTTSRGKVELDVYAEEDVMGRKYSIICECKYWKADISQNVVHGFRTVVNDLGCNVGYIITISNYQKGAVLTAKFTNVELLTWEEFKNKFFESWFENYFIVKMTSELDPLMTYTEPILPKWFSKMTSQDKETFYNLKHKYDVMGYITMVLFSTYSRSLVKTEIPKLPLIKLVKDAAQFENKIPLDLLNEKGYKEFLTKAIEFGQTGISKFRLLRDKYEEHDTYE